MFEWLSNIFKSKTGDLPSPRDIINKDDIVYNDLLGQVIITNMLPTIWLTEPANTKSMDPTVDAGHTCILTNNFSHADLQVGDIVVYRAYDRYILHRIAKITTDDKGRRFRLKSDRVPWFDRYIVRDEHILWLLVAIIY